MQRMTDRARACAALGMVVAGLALAGAPPARAQNEAAASDPTRAGAAITDALKAQLIGLRTATLKAVVVAHDGGGVALLEVKDNGQIVVRSNSQFTATIAGFPLKVVVRDVTPAGVQIEAPTLSERLLLPGSLGPAAAPAESPSALRHAEFRGIPLGDAIRMLSEQSGMNYSASAEAGKVVVSVFLRNVTAQVVVEELCKSHNLWFKQDAQTGILRILTMEEFQRDLVSFREEQSEVFTLLYPNVMEVAAAIQSLYGDRVELSLGRSEAMDESRDLAQRFQRFDMINQRSQGYGSMGGYGGGYGYGNSYGSGFSGYGTGYGVYGSGGYGYGYGSGYGGYGGYGGSDGGIGTTVVVGGAYGPNVWSSGRNAAGAAAAEAKGPEFRDLTPEQAQRVQKLMAPEAPTSTNAAPAALDAYRQQQASILVTVSRRNNMIIVRTSDSNAMDDIKQLIRRLDVPTPLVLLEVKILGVDLSDGFNSVFDYQMGAVVTTPSGVGLTTAGFTSGEIQPPAAGSMTPGGSGVRSGDMTFQVVNEYFRARMQLLEERGRVTTLATPFLMTANNEVSRLFLGEERPLIRNVTGQTLITENTVATTPNTTVEFRPVGTTLLITPNINSDRTVTLRLLQEDSSINSGGASVPIVTSATGAVQNVSVDVVATKSISGTFVAKDDMAVAIGGLIQEKVSDVRAQVPVLGRIPILGALFRRETKSKTRQEMVIMIRPHVISTPSEGEELSRQLLNGLSAHPSAPNAKGDMNTFRESAPKAQKPAR